MGGAVDVVAGDMALSHADVLITGIVGGLIALAHNIGAADDPVSQIAALALDAVGAVDLLTVQIHVGLHIQQTLFIGLIGANTPAGFVSTFDSHWYYHPFLCSQKKCVMGAKVILFVSVTLY